MNISTSCYYCIEVYYEIVLRHAKNVQLLVARTPPSDFIFGRTSVTTSVSRLSFQPPANHNFFISSRQIKNIDSISQSAISIFFVAANELIHFVGFDHLRFRASSVLIAIINLVIFPTFKKPRGTDTTSLPLSLSLASSESSRPHHNQHDTNNTNPATIRQDELQA